MTSTSLQRDNAAPWYGLPLLLLLGSLWGSTFSLSKVAIVGGIPELGYGFWQSLGPAIVLSIAAILQGAGLARDRKTMLFCFVSAQLGITIPNIIFYYVISHIPAGLMSVVVTFAPMLTFTLAVSLALERFTWFRIGGLFLGLCGALLIVLPESALPKDLPVGWLLVAFLTPTFYSLSSVYTSRFRPAGRSTLTIASGAMISAALMQGVALLFVSGFYVPLPPFGEAEAALFSQIAVSSLAYFCMYHLINVAGPVFFSQVGYIVTLTGLVWGMVFFGEQHSGFIYAATALIFAGLFLVNYRKRASA